MKKFARTLPEAKEQFLKKTGVNFNPNVTHHSGIKIWKLKSKKTNTRRYFVGSFIEWLNA